MSNTSNASESRSHPLSSVLPFTNNSMLFWDYRRWSIKGFTPNKSIYLSYNTLTQLNLSVIDKEFMILPRTRAVLVLDAVIHYQQKINSLQQKTPLQFSLACFTAATLVMSATIIAVSAPFPYCYYVVWVVLACTLYKCSCTLYLCSSSMFSNYIPYPMMYSFICQSFIFPY